MSHSSTSADLLVVGGGLVGTAIAWGASRQGLRVTLLDAGDGDYRASRGNFGLVWVQGKGYGHVPYARWTMGSAQLWPTLAQALLDETGIDVQLKQPGGFHICLSEADLATRRARLQSIRDELGSDYPYTWLTPEEARVHLPGLGPDVVGVSHCPLDGHLNPLKMLRALHTGCQRRGVALHNGTPVAAVTAVGGGFQATTAAGTFEAPRIVLAAGLGNRALAPMLGLRAPMIPNRGNVLISERMQPFLNHPTTHIRQTDEGTIQFGESMEEVGLNDTTSDDMLQMIALRGARSFPALAELQLVRVWAALRVMTPDGFPLYAESPTHPGAFVTACHSGVTLGAAHALKIAPWVAGGAAPDGIATFTDRRFTDDTTTGVATPT